MKASEDLFLLIKSLSGREKAYFKRSATLHSERKDKNYLKLFAAIDSMQSYDEAALKKKLAGQSLLRNFSHEKAYLYRHLLRSLAAYHADNSVSKKLATVREHAELLIERRLFEGGFKLIEKGLKEARKHEEFAVWLELLELKIEAHTRQWTTQLTDEIRELHREREEVMAKMKNLDDYVGLRFMVFDLQDDEGFVSSTSESDDFKRLCEHRLLQDPKCAESIRAMERYHYNKRLLQFLGREFCAWHHDYAAYITFVEEHAYLFGPNTFNQLYSNYLLACIKARDREGFNLTVEKMEAQIAQSGREQAAERNFLDTRWLELHSARGEFDEGVRKMPDILNRLNSYEDILPAFSREIIMVSVARIYMEAGQFQDAQAMFERYFNIKEVNKSSPVYFVQRLLHAICYIELGQFSLVESSLRSVQRLLHRADQLGPFQRLFVKFLTKLPKAVNSSDILTLLEKTRNDIVDKVSRSDQNRILEYYHFIPWLDSKIQERDFQEVVQEYLSTEAG